MKDKILTIKVPFAVSRYVTPIADIICRRIKQLIDEIQGEGYKIDMGFILGGFSFCSSLVDKV
jgi:hypothetical protein